MTENSSDEFISVPVPRRYVTKVYELIVGLDSDEPGAKPGESPSRNGGPSAALTETLVKRMYGDSWDPHQQLMKHLADHAGEWLSTREVAESLGLPHGAKSLAGSLGAFGRRAEHRYGGLKPWESRWRAAEGQSEHRMSPEVATWIKQAAS
jgi:hypothetical protein